MSEVGEAMGSAMEGGLYARALEPKAGEGDDGHTHEDACLNCGTELVGPHCHACGQQAHVHRTLRAFFHDLLHGVLHFEGKTWRTLPMLAWKPGVLTREYIAGKRAKYISPIALFLFVVFVSFALWSALGGVGEIETDVDPASAQQMEASVASLDEDIAELEKDIAESRAAGGSQNEIAALENELEAKRKGRRLTSDLLGTLAGQEAADDVDVTIAGADTAAERDLADWLQHAWSKAKANPSLLVYKLQTNAYKLSWVLIPLSLPFMWLLFPFSRRLRMYDHTVFVTYSIAFMTILVVIASLGAYLQFQPLVIAPLLYAPFHLYRQLRGAYGLSRAGALWRLVALSAVIWVVLGLFGLIMLGLVIG